MTTRKLIIHTGCHKTGSSSLQVFLRQKEHVLISHDIGVFTKGGHSNAWFILKCDAQGVQPIIKSGLAKALAETKGKTVIISSENFSWLDDMAQLKCFKESLSQYFEEIEVVFYIRRQDKHIVSHHQQGSKNITFVENSFYGTEPRAIPSYKEVFDRYLDYDKRISMWEKSFSLNCIKVRVFEKKLLVKGCVVSDFLSLFSIPLQAKSIRDNESNGTMRTYVAHLMNDLRIKPELHDLIAKELDNSGKLLPSKFEAIGFYERYKASNENLNKRYNLTGNKYIFDDDFSIYPEQETKPSLSDINKAFKIILAVTQDFHNKIKKSEGVEEGAGNIEQSEKVVIVPTRRNKKSFLLRKFK